MFLQKLRGGFGRVVSVANYAALVSCFMMVFIVAVDVILRKLQLGSIAGSNELTTYLMVPVCMLGIPALQLKGGHVWVDLFVRLFPYRFRCFWRCAVSVVETGIIGLLAYGGYLKIVMFLRTSTASDILNMPKWIFAIAVLAAFAEYFVLSLIDTLQLCLDGARGGEKPVEDGGWSDGQVKGI
ncbi:MAG: TRAP transporter small permease subunit [Clostridiales bacterium]|nr:TRAP transporter small permease subunit [Clostridiales bacterium]